MVRLLFATTVSYTYLFALPRCAATLRFVECRLFALLCFATRSVGRWTEGKTKVDLA